MVSANLIDVLEVLEKDKKIFEIFKSCPYYILRQIKLKKYVPGEFVLNQGQIYDTIFVIVEGEVDIYVESAQGKRFYFTSYKRGAFIGELEVFNRKPYMCYVEAKDAIITLEMTRDLFMERISQDKQFHEYFTSFITNEHFKAMEEMCVHMLYPLKQKICMRLIENAELRGGGNTAMSAETLSAHMGVTTRSVQRVLKELREKGIIDIHKTKVVILDMERLKKELNEQ